MKLLRAFGFGVITFQLLTILALGLTVLTFFSILSNAFVGDTFRMSLGVDEATGDWRVTMNASPKNSGLLGVTMGFEMGILTPEGVYLARNSTSVRIDPGASRSLTLVLSVPADVALENGLQQNRGTLDIVLSVRTLWDLVEVKNAWRVEGGG